MSETLKKLRPDRDLQCFFFRPTAIAALSVASSSGFTVSGTWRQQFDWAVIEWNRDNVYAHPLLRPLPDGDLSGLTLSYRETRTNCIPIDSGLFPTVDWPTLRVWAANASGVEQIYKIPLLDNAIVVQGSYVAASATFGLSGTLTGGDVVELSWLDEHYFHTVSGADTFTSVLADLATNVNAFSTTVSASATSSDITLTNLTAGEEGNRLGIVGTVTAAQTEVWSPDAQTMSGGQSPTQWQVDLDFSNVLDELGTEVPMQAVRKMRWTYAAALQESAYQRSEFDVVVSDWVVTGTGRAYSVAGPLSRRFEDDSSAASYSGTWQKAWGNFSGSTIQKTNTVGSEAAISYDHPQTHQLYLGARLTFESGIISVSVDGGTAQQFDLFLPGEDALVRLDLGSFTAGPHSVEASLVGANPLSPDNSFYFDYAEAAVAASAVEEQPAVLNETLATDWDTDHSLALAPERVAWNMNMLGFKGRANHYVGAILFYELTNPTALYAQATVTFQGTPVFSQTVQVILDSTVFSRATLSTDTNESIAKNFEYLINNGSTGVRASAAGAVLTIFSRALGAAGNSTTLSASPTSGAFQAVASGSSLSGGADGEWITDLSALPRLNRAARDWHRAYFAALDGFGVESTAALSTELSHGDRSLGAGIAQRYPNLDPVELNTPALQTNFSPTSAAFWEQAYLELAQMQVEAGVAPSLQFGEVQWWYFPAASGMTFYDDYTTSTFQATYSRAMQVFTSNDDSLAGFPEEAAFLPGLIGAFTQRIRNFVKATYAATKFEVLYPHDVNDFTLTRVVNYPTTDWTPANLNTLKTENFTYTGSGNLNKALESIRFPLGLGFTREDSAHLIGVLSTREPWPWERRLAHREDIESVVFWAFDQFSIIGYPLPLPGDPKRSKFFGPRS